MFERAVRCGARVLLLERCEELLLCANRVPVSFVYFTAGSGSKWHRVGDLPAFFREDGRMGWWFNNTMHRDRRDASGALLPAVVRVETNARRVHGGRRRGRALDCEWWVHDKRVK